MLTVILSAKDVGRIFSKISIDKKTGCWNWKGALNTYGYGETWFNRRMEVTHRLMYAWLVTPIPQGVGSSILILDHFVCENRACCNPQHLRLTSTKENLRRTNSVSAVNRRKTHCIREHLLPTTPNRPSGYGRTCKICLSITGRRRYQRNKAVSSNLPATREQERNDQ